MGKGVESQCLRRRKTSPERRRIRSDDATETDVIPPEGRLPHCAETPCLKAQRSRNRQISDCPESLQSPRHPPPASGSVRRIFDFFYSDGRKTPRVARVRGHNLSPCSIHPRHTHRQRTMFPSRNASEPDRQSPGILPVTEQRVPSLEEESKDRRRPDSPRPKPTIRQPPPHRTPHAAATKRAPSCHRLARTLRPSKPPGAASPTQSVKPSSAAKPSVRTRAQRSSLPPESPRRLPLERRAGKASKNSVRTRPKRGVQNGARTPLGIAAKTGFISTLRTARFPRRKAPPKKRSGSGVFFSMEFDPVSGLDFSARKGRASAPEKAAFGAVSGRPETPTFRRANRGSRTL